MSRLSVQCSLLASPDIHTKLVLLKSYNLSMRELIEQRSSGDGRSHESQKGRERPQVQLGVARIATCVPHMFAATSSAPQEYHYVRLIRFIKYHYSLLTGVTII